MTKYSFKGIVTTFNNCEIPFRVVDGIVRFSLQSKAVLPHEKHNVLLKGLTDNRKIIYLLVDHFYEIDFGSIKKDGEETIEPPHLEGVVQACAVLDSGTIDNINSIGFYSLLIPSITGFSFSGVINDSNALWMGIKNTFGKYTLNNRKYRLSIGFVENKPHYSGQLLELKTDGNFDLESMKKSYWQIKKLFAFLFQKWNVPIDSIFLRVNEKNIGELFVERLEESKFSVFGVKCIQTNILEGKIDRLLQLIADQKIYLRHVPMFKDEEEAYTPGRFLMALVGLENTLDLMDVHVKHNGKHLNAINNSKRKLDELVTGSAGYEKKIFKRLLNQLQKEENFESRILASLIENKDYIVNFFPLEILGDCSTIAKDLGDVRNDLAHGDLNAGFSIKTNSQMHFLMLYVLYLQLRIIGFDKKEASGIVPQILFDH